MDWVQCNHCGLKPGQAKLFLTMCGHVFCPSCIARAKDQLCFFCKKPIKADEINKNLRPELLELFKDPRQVAADFLAEIKQVVTFQSKQREIFMKFKQIESKRDADALNDAKSRQMKAAQEMERRKSSLAEEYERLKAAKERKRQLTEELRMIEATKRARTSEPPVSRMAARFRAPPGMSRRTSHEPHSSILLDQSTSKIVTSTPIANIEISRRDYLNRMFAAGQDHPSPIPRGI